jgi:AcrR family transcriptional regulator
MARPKSGEKHSAILAAAITQIALHGAGASTAKIASLAGVAEGTLFVYFESKDGLLNAAYLALKAELASEVGAAALPGQLRERLLCAWSAYVAWGVSNPEKRRALAQLSVSSRITESSKQEGDDLLDADGTMREALFRKGGSSLAIDFRSAVIRSLAETTIDFITLRPEEAVSLTADGFAAAWNSLELPKVEG